MSTDLYQHALSGQLRSAFEKGDTVRRRRDSLVATVFSVESDCALLTWHDPKHPNMVMTAQASLDDLELAVEYAA